jgi:hypothetical protein
MLRYDQFTIRVAYRFKRIGNSGALDLDSRQHILEKMRIKIVGIFDEISKREMSLFGKCGTSGSAVPGGSVLSLHWS